MTGALHGDRAATICLVTYDLGVAMLHLTGGAAVSLGSTLVDQGQRDFWRRLGALVGPGGRVDPFACDLAAGNEGALLVAALQELTGCTVAGSTDATGGSGANWLLEAGDVDGAEYFVAERLRNFRGRLKGHQKVVASDAALSDCFGFSVALSGDTAVVGACYDDVGLYEDAGSVWFLTNHAPVAVADSGSTNEDTLLTQAAPGVLGNDTDAEGDALQVTASDAASAEGAAVVVNADGSYTYDPRGLTVFGTLAAGESLDDTFSYTVSDGHEGTAVATATITVAGVNDVPTGLALDHDSVLEGQAPNALVGTLSSSDADASDTHTYSLVAGTGDGGNGDFIVSGAELRTARSLDRTVATSRSILVQTDDGHGGTFEQAFTVTVEADRAAVAYAGPAVVLSDATAAGPVVTLSDGAVAQPTFVAPAVDGEGVALRFELTVTDGVGLMGADSCLVNVTSTNQPPVAVAGEDQTVNAGDLVLLDGTASLDAGGGGVSGWALSCLLPFAALFCAPRRRRKGRHEGRPARPGSRGERSTRRVVFSVPGRREADWPLPQGHGALREGSIHHKA